MSLCSFLDSTFGEVWEQLCCESFAMILPLIILPFIVLTMGLKPSPETALELPTDPVGAIASWTSDWKLAYERLAQTAGRNRRDRIAGGWQGCQQEKLHGRNTQLLDHAVKPLPKTHTP